MTDRRLEEKEQVKEDKKVDVSAEEDKDDDKKEKQADSRRTHALNIKLDHNGIGTPMNIEETQHHDEQYKTITVAKEQRAKSEAKVNKHNWRRLIATQERHKELAKNKARHLQISDSRASAANDLELLLETRLAWLADWLETQWEEGFWTRFEFSNKWIGAGKDRNERFKTQIINILRCMIDSQMSQKKVSPTGNRTRNYYRRAPRIAGGWVGVCRCPDGQRVWVGDRHDGCRRLACFGGTAEFCKRGFSNSGRYNAMSCATGGQRAPVFWRKRFNQFHEKKCMEIDWSDPDPASSLEDVTTTDMSNGNAAAANRRRVNFSIFNYLWMNIKYPVASKDFPKLVVKPIEKLRNLVANGDLEMEIFSSPLYNRFFKFNGKHVNYARANTLNVGRVLASESDDTKQTRVLEGISTPQNLSIKKKSKKMGFNTGNEKFDMNLMEIGEMQKEITRRLSKLMAIRKARRNLAVKVRYEIKSSIQYEITKDLTSGGFDKIDLDLIGISKKNPYHEIIRSFAINKKLVKMEEIQQDFIKGASHLLNFK